MKIIISPAKKMHIDEETFSVLSEPVFVEEAGKIKDRLKAMSREELKKLWKCSDELTDQNIERLKSMELHSNLSAAISSYEGIQYQYMSPRTLESDALTYLDKHLRIISGFYGIVSPFDGVREYRLEMQALLKFEDKKNLYDFWGSRICDYIIEEDLKSDEDEVIINLASEEYSKAVLPYINGRVRCVSISFLKLTDKGLKKQATLQKMARGEMVRYMAVHKITDIDSLKAFNGLGFEFCEEMSDESNLIFIKKNI
ncbi:MAG: peroxide stress protein YaaA [Eubacteriales bacterium]|nr:peroxide stress protein YaaA [Eubacteriales bacterium]